jgi:hypothetical protein
MTHLDTSKITARVIREVAGTIATNGIQDLNKTETGGVSQFGYVRACLMSTAYNALRAMPGSMAYGPFCDAVLAQVEKDLQPEPVKTPGQLAYEEDCRLRPYVTAGELRPTWDELDSIYSPSAAAAIRNSWHRNPTPRE